MGWEIMCLGRIAAGEKFSHGSIRQETEIFYQGKRIWGEYASIKAGDKILAAAAGLSGKPVTGTFIMAGVVISNELLSELRAVQLENTSAYVSVDVSAVTRMGALLIVRYLGHSSEAARHYFVAIWRLLRPAVCGRVACNPRIWST